MSLYKEVLPISSDSVRTRFARNLELFRESEGLTQEELSQKCGYDRTYVGKIERGDKDPSLESIIRITEALDIPASSLFEDPDSREKIEEELPERNESEIYRTVFQEAEHLIILTNPKGVILQLNEEVMGYTGEKMKDLIGIPVIKANIWNFSEDQKERLRSALIAAENGEKSELDFTTELEERKETSLTLNVTPVSLEKDISGEVDFLIIEGFVKQD